MWQYFISVPIFDNTLCCSHLSTKVANEAHTHYKMNSTKLQMTIIIKTQ